MSQSERAWVVRIAFAVGVVVVLVVAVVVFLVVRVTVSRRDVAWIAGGSSPAADEAEVYTRYLVRHRRHRAVGGLFGVTFALVTGLAWVQGVSLGVGNGSPLADLLWCGLAGVILGALSAESFRLSEPPSSTIAASLAARAEVAPRRTVLVARALCLVALVLGGACAVLGLGWAPLLVALGGTAMVVAAHVTLGAISARRRPVLSERAAEVDLRMRVFAGRSVSRLGVAAGLLTLAWTVSKLPETDSVVLGVLAVVVVLGLAVAAVVDMVRAAPRPPRAWSPVPA